MFSTVNINYKIFIIKPDFGERKRIICAGEILGAFGYREQQFVLRIYIYKYEKKKKKFN